MSDAPVPDDWWASMFDADYVRVWTAAGGFDRRPLTPQGRLVVRAVAA